MSIEPAIHLRRARPATVLAAVCFLGLAFPPAAGAERTRFWRQSDFENFERGTAKGTAVRSDGKIALAPKFTELADTGMAYLWDLKTDSRGNVYAAGGSGAKVVRLDASSRMSTLFDSSELAAQALAIDGKDNLYVGTSPDGKVYKVTPDGKKSVFFDPQTKYIWALAAAPDGTLYVATGDAGKIFSVSAEGKGQLFYTSSETHIRSLALDGKGNLLAGTDPNGLVLRIPLAAPSPGPATNGNRKSATAPPDPPERQAYVLYETARREITSLLAEPSGDIYVAAIGEKTRPPQPAPGAAPAPQPAPAATVQGGAQAQNQIFQPFPAVNSSAVYHIAPDGAPEELWNSRDDVVYTLARAGNGALLLGSGNQGSVIQLETNRIFSRLVKSNTGQVTGLARGAGGKLFVATANPGKIFALGPELQAQGSFESQPFDARIFSRWGRLTWFAEGAGASSGSIELYVRAGNTSDPENNWSAWAGPYRNPNGEQVQAPPARFAQWKAVLHGGAGPAPELSWVSLAYLPKNLAPRIDAVAVQNPGIRLAGGAGQNQPNIPLRLPAAPAASGAPRPAEAAPAVRPDPPPQGSAQKGQQSIIWAADDPNEDELTYSVYYRAENETAWKLLRDHLSQKFYSWDTTSMPDGAYYVKVVASDEKSNAAGDALTAERESDRFMVDNTAPVISAISADVAPNARDATIKFTAKDAASAIVLAQYSLDAGDWTLILPSGGLSDSLEESYSLLLHDLPPGEHTVAVRAYDQYDNLGAGKVTFTAAQPRR